MRTRISAVACLLACAGTASSVRADELWVAPTYQQDVGGLGVGSKVVWPVTAFGVARFAWGVPDNLQSFQSARLVLIREGAEGGGDLALYVCRAQNGDFADGACEGPFTHPFVAVTDQLLEVDITGAIAPHVGAPGGNHLAVVAFTTPSTATDHIVGMRFAYAPTVPPGAATLGANTFSGTQSAPAFVGDGSGLTNLPIPAGAATLGANTFSGTQAAPAFVGDGSGLVNLPFPAGAATIGPNTFTGTQTVNGGNVDLDPSTSTSGNLTKNGSRFLHTAGTQNLFLGVNAGNFATTGQTNTGVGVVALANNSSGSANTAIGHSALVANTTGAGNTATGAGVLVSNISGGGNTAAGTNALGDNTGGNENVAEGTSALRSNTTGSFNTATGGAALFSNTTGGLNTAAGRNALRDNTTGSQNTAVGAEADVSAGDLTNATAIGSGAVVDASHKIRLGNANVMLVETAGNLRVGAGSPAGCVQDGDGSVLAGACVSDARLKTDVAPFPPLLDRLVHLEPVHFRWRAQAYPELQLGSTVSFGLIAQETEKVLPELVTENAQGFKVVRYHLLPVMLLRALKEQQEIIRSQAADVAELEARIGRLERMVTGRGLTP